MYFNIVLYVMFLFFGFHAGKVLGFQDGVDSVEYDRVRSNQVLQQCLAIIRHE
jgi:hypothetical protein